MSEEEMKHSEEQIYMNEPTGLIGPREEWWYENEQGKEVNAVDEEELIAVVWNFEEDCWEDGYLSDQ